MLDPSPPLEYHTRAAKEIEWLLSIWLLPTPSLLE